MDIIREPLPSVSKRIVLGNLFNPPLLKLNWDSLTPSLRLLCSLISSYTRVQLLIRYLGAMLPLLKAIFRQNSFWLPPREGDKTSSGGIDMPILEADIGTLDAKR